MHSKKAACAALAGVLIMSGFCANALAAERRLGDGPIGVLAIERATNRFDWNVPAGSAAKADTSFTLETGDTVNIRASYFPQDAKIYFGLEDANGTYHYVNVTDGSVDKTFQITKTGTYTLVIKNKSSEPVEVTGFIKS